MKYVKFNMSKGEPVILPMNKAKEVMKVLIETPTKLVMITDEKGEWTGETISKSFLNSTTRDRDRERSQALKETKNYIAEPSVNLNKLKQLKQNLISKKIIRKN